MFKGDKILKFIIQWVSASVAGRKMLFHTIMDIEFRQAKKLVTVLSCKNAGEVTGLVVSYSKMKIKLPDDRTTLLQYLLQTVQPSDSTSTNIS